MIVAVKRSAANPSKQEEATENAMHTSPDGRVPLKSASNEMSSRGCIDSHWIENPSPKIVFIW